MSSVIEDVTDEATISYLAASVAPCTDLANSFAGLAGLLHLSGEMSFVEPVAVTRNSVGRQFG